MNNDPTEPLRRELVRTINENPNERAALEAKYGQVWDTDELRRDFDVTGFMAPLVFARRKSDGKKGALGFQHLPRYYFGFEAND